MGEAVSTGASEREAGCASWAETAYKVVRSLPLILAVSLLTLWVNSLGWLRPFENTLTDVLLATLSSRARGSAIVEITEDDFARLFDSRIPLNPDRVIDIIRLIAAAGPACVVVDIDTGSRSYQALADTARLLPLIACVDPAAVPGKKARIPGASYALAYLPVDEDGVIRRYSSRLPDRAASLSGSEDIATVPVAVQRALAGGATEAGPGGSRLIAFSRASATSYISASELLRVAAAPGGKEALRQMLSQKIVLIGGVFAQARELYATPVGPRHGVEILADAIETEMRWGGIRPVADWLPLVMQVAVSLFVVVASARHPGRVGPFLGLIVIPAASIAISGALLLAFALWVNFVPVLFAVQMLNLYEHFKEVRKKNAMLLSANDELRAARTELALALDRGAEGERRRLARELHDDTLGRLFQVSAALSPLLKNESAREVAGRALDAVTDTTAGIRQIMQDLYPPVIDRYGLNTALAELARSAASDKVQVDYACHCAAALDELAKDRRVAVYRIVQQALGNALQHSGCDRIAIAARLADDGSLVFTVSDDGSGMSGDERRADAYGMDSMRSRAELHGGRLTWSSPAELFGRGTEVRLILASSGAGDHQACPTNIQAAQ